MKNNCGIDFDNLLNEKLKNPKFKKGFKRADKILKLENNFNALLKTMGIKDMFVEVKDIAEY